MRLRKTLTTITAALAVLCLGIAITTHNTTEATAWTSSATPDTPPPTMLLTTASLMPIVAYVNAVDVNAERTYAAAVQTNLTNERAAAARAAAATTSPPASTTAAPVISGASYDDAVSTDTPDWACIRQHESGGNYNEPNGGGAYQIELGTWQGYDGYPNASSAPPSVQDAKALALYNSRGWEPWTTRYMCGL